MAKEAFQYKIELKYITKDNIEVTIDSEQLQYIAIDKDFDNINMPVVAVNGSIEKDIIDDMIENINNNLITLGIYVYDISNQSDNITTKYFHDRFIYIIQDDISKTADIDYPNGEDRPGLYKDITIWLLQQDAVNNNKTSINGVFKNASMNSLILMVGNYLGNILLEPIKYDNKFDQILIPPQESISNYIEFLNRYVSVFYDTQYRFFIDFDTTYITSSSGKVTKSRDQNIFTIELNIKDIIPNDEDSERGMITDIENNKYVVYVNNANVDYVKNNVSNKLVNKITVVDSSGNVTERDIENNQTGITTTMNNIISLRNTDGNAAANVISSSISQNNVVISIVKNDLDASIFTMNKEYIITDPSHEEYNGRYLLISSKQLFIKQSEYYVMTSILRFRKI